MLFSPDRAPANPGAVDWGQLRPRERLARSDSDHDYIEVMPELAGRPGLHRARS